MDKIAEKINLWGYGEGGAWLSGAITGAGLWLNAFVGGYDLMISVLIRLMAVDYVTGFLASLKHKTTNSSIMFWGGVNKFLVISLVGLGVVLDSLMGNTQPIIRTAIIWFYIGRELLSIIENYGKLGLPLPDALKQALVQITNKGGNK